MELDFAGGLVVHATAGVGALVTAVVIGSRRKFPTSINPPHSPVITMIGASMLWVGWFVALMEDLLYQLGQTLAWQFY